MLHMIVNTILLSLFILVSLLFGFMFAMHPDAGALVAKVLPVALGGAIMILIALGILRRRGHALWK